MSEKLRGGWRLLLSGSRLRSQQFSPIGITGFFLEGFGWIFLTNFGPCFINTTGITTLILI